MYSNKLKLKIGVLLQLILILYSCEQDNFETISLEVETIEVTEITTKSVKAYGVINGVGNGIVNYGHCWSLGEIPTINSNLITHSSSIIDTFWTKLENLNHSTYYYVRAFVYDGSNYAYGDILNFYTQEITFNIIAPTSGEEIDDETNYELKWETIGDVERVNIYYEEDAGNNDWTNIILNLSNSGNYIWPVPAIEDGYYWQQCRIKIEDSNDSEIFVISKSFMLRKL